jgi:hypothetical protein
MDVIDVLIHAGLAPSGAHASDLAQFINQLPRRVNGRVPKPAMMLLSK